MHRGARARRRWPLRGFHPASASRTARPTGREKHQAPEDGGLWLASVATLSDRLAAGHFDALRIDPAVVFDQQARDHRADVVGHARRGPARSCRRCAVEPGIVAHRAAAEVGLDRAGRHRVDARCRARRAPWPGTGSAPRRRPSPPRRPHSRDSEKRVRPVDRLTMRPPSAISGSSAWVRKNAPLKCTSTRRSNCASVVSAIDARVAMAGVVDQVVEACRVARRRAARLRRRSAKAAKCRDLAGIQLQGDGGAGPAPAISRDDGLRFVGLAAVGEDHVAASARDVQGSVAAQAAAAAGDEGDLGH